MASVINRPNGHKWVQFIDGNDKRQTVRLGKTNKRHAEKVKTIIEEVQAAKFAQNPILPDTAKWLAECPEWMYSKLVAVGLVESRSDKATAERLMLREFVAEFIDERRGTKKTNTVSHHERVRDDLLACFGDGCEMATVTKADVNRLRLWYERKGYSPNTINRRIGRAKQFWLAAIDAERLDKNPFKGQDCQVRANEEKFYFVERATVNKVLGVVPCAEWQLVIALMRYAGLRVCELFTLEWRHVDWEQCRVLIDSPKTGARYIPLFQEIKPYLERCFDLAAEGERFVVTRFKNRNANLRTQFGRWCDKASVPRWVKPFQNMRASCEVDLNRQGYPQHTVARWMGHSENVAFKHYLRTTDDEFRRASGAKLPEAEGEAVSAQGEAQPEADKARPVWTPTDNMPVFLGEFLWNAGFLGTNPAFKAPRGGRRSNVRLRRARCLAAQ